jgi:hypothetical protein
MLSGANSVAAEIGTVGSVVMSTSSSLMAGACTAASFRNSTVLRPNGSPPRIAPASASRRPTPPSGFHAPDVTRGLSGEKKPLAQYAHRQPVADDATVAAATDMTRGVTPTGWTWSRGASPSPVTSPATRSRTVDIEGSSSAMSSIQGARRASPTTPVVIARSVGGQATSLSPAASSRCVGPASPLTSARCLPPPSALLAAGNSPVPSYAPLQAVSATARPQAASPAVSLYRPETRHTCSPRVLSAGRR